jgi:hypothetical protein
LGLCLGNITGPRTFGNERTDLGEFKRLMQEGLGSPLGKLRAEDSRRRRLPGLSYVGSIAASVYPKLGISSRVGLREALAHV